jgi:hypothetical protein
MARNLRRFRHALREARAHVQIRNLSVCHLYTLNSSEGDLPLRIAQHTTELEYSSVVILDFNPLVGWKFQRRQEAARIKI